MSSSRTELLDKADSVSHTTDVSGDGDKGVMAA